ncbi:MAG: M23 family metallopeptidase, partial [Bacteroidia bacterium]|nr:M23 family metallopeptidase [Bacteroidia bacterium]
AISHFNNSCGFDVMGGGSISGNDLTQNLAKENDSSNSIETIKDFEYDPKTNTYTNKHTGKEVKFAIVASAFAKIGSSFKYLDDQKLSLEYYFGNGFAVGVYEYSRSLVSIRLSSFPESSAWSKGDILKSSSFGTQFPIENPYVGSDYGERNGSMHHGIDLINGQKGEVNGKLVRSISNGKVVRLVTNTDDGQRGGVRVRIQASSGYQYNYFHLQTGSNAHLSLGLSINVGDLIGKVGNTGVSHGAHLHFEIWDANGKKVNPYSVYPLLYSIPHR